MKVNNFIEVPTFCNGTLICYIYDQMSIFCYIPIDLSLCMIDLTNYDFI